MENEPDKLPERISFHLMKTKTDRFKSKNELLMSRAAKNNYSPGRDFHYIDQLELRDLKNRAKLKKDVFQSRKEFRSLFNEFMAPRHHESNVSMSSLVGVSKSLHLRNLSEMKIPAAHNTVIPRHSDMHSMSSTNIDLMTV